MNKSDFIICLPTKWIWLAIFVSILLTMLLISLNISRSSNLAANTIGPLVIVVLLVGSYAGVREKVIIKGNHITVTTFLGKTKKYTFNDIRKITEHSWSNGMVTYSVHGEKKLFSISDTLPGFNLFLSIIKEKNIYIETIEEQIKNRKGRG